MKRWGRKAVASMLCMILVLASPSIALAVSTAGTLDELAREVENHGMNREKEFSIEYTGKDADLDKLFAEKNYEFFFNRMSVQDDPTTSDDADYLIGNTDFSSKEFDFESDENGIVNFRMRYFETLDQTAYVNSQVPQILSQLGVAGMSNYEKVKTIHDYVCKLITYNDLNDSDLAFCMYGALSGGKAVCNSYSLCMYKLLVEAGVPCKYISGEAGTGRDADGHAWNIVALGDKWYYLDTTWDDDDKNNIVTYDYFLKGSSDFDAFDPTQLHKKNPCYASEPFKSTFPIAKTAFNPTLMSDVNEVVTIGGTEAGTPDEGDTYEFDDIVEGKWPKSGKFSVKWGKTGKVQLFLHSDAAETIQKVSYKVTTGNGRINKIKNYGVLEEDGEYYTNLTFKGKKAGKVNIQIILTLDNGQKLTCTFKGKVKWY